MLTLSSLRLLAMFLLLVPSILVVTAAPLMDVDMAVQVERRTESKDDKRRTTRSIIMITHTRCADPLIYVNSRRAYSPQVKPNSQLFTGVSMPLQTSKNIAVIDLTTPQKFLLYQHIEENITGTSKWDYILRVMQYLEQNLASFQFTSGGKEKWDEMQNECGGMEKPMEQPMEEPMEKPMEKPKTSVMHLEYEVEPPLETLVQGLTLRSHLDS
ncbi:hypothetical protein F5877DRAFT_68727 [Lentinula edodes]|nr:hypothetical protein F5877DRAFT_68727 [Lentinula edodes]